MKTNFVFHVCLLLGISLCATLASSALSPVTFFAKSVRSDIFIPLRPTTPPALIEACGIVETGYGLLNQTYNRGQVAEGMRCIWRLRAPKNHVVNIISTAFKLSNPTSDKLSEYDASESSVIKIYDSEKPDDNLLATFFVVPNERAGGFVQSISSSQDMVVEIVYRDNVDFATQNIQINYEFLDFDEMLRLLRT